MHLEILDVNVPLSKAGSLDGETIEIARRFLGFPRSSSMKNRDVHGFPSYSAMKHIESLYVFIAFRDFSMKEW